MYREPTCEVYVNSVVDCWAKELFPRFTHARRSGRCQRPASARVTERSSSTDKYYVCEHHLDGWTENDDTLWLIEPSCFIMQEAVIFA